MLALKILLSQVLIAPIWSGPQLPFLTLQPLQSQWLSLRSADAGSPREHYDALSIHMRVPLKSMMCFRIIYLRFMYGIMPYVLLAGTG